METLKLYLTSLEPNLSQNIYSQSIGGYISNSLVYPETDLVSTMGLYNTNLTLRTPDSGDWLEWQGIEYINIGNELMKVPPIVNGSIVVSQRGYNNIFNMHIVGDAVRAAQSKELFNDVFNDDYKQYRCIAIKNISTNLLEPSIEQVAYDIGVYLKQNSRNINAPIKISLEKANTQYLSSISTSWGTDHLTDTSLIGHLYQNAYKDAYLVITDGGGGAKGQGRLIASYEPTTGVFGFYSTFS